MAGRSDGNSSSSMRICGSPPAEAPIATMSRWELALAMGKPTMTVQRRQKAHRAQKARTTKPMMTATAGRTISQTWAAPKARGYPIRQTTTPASPIGGGSPPSCSSGPPAANAPESLMLFQVVSIQPPERWTCAMRNSSIWPLKGSANVRHMPRRIANLRDRGCGSRSVGCPTRSCRTPIPLAVRRRDPEVGARCASSAPRDLCGAANNRDQNGMRLACT